MIDLYFSMSASYLPYYGMNLNLPHYLPRWGRGTHICVGKLVIIGSDNGLSPRRRRATIWTNVGISSIWPLGTNVSEVLVGIHTFWFNKMHLKMFFFCEMVSTWSRPQSVKTAMLMSVSWSIWYHAWANVVLSRSGGYNPSCVYASVCVWTSGGVQLNSTKHWIFPCLMGSQQGNYHNPLTTRLLCAVRKA